MRLGAGRPFGEIRGRQDEINPFGELLAFGFRTGVTERARREGAEVDVSLEIED